MGEEWGERDCSAITHFVSEALGYQQSLNEEVLQFGENMLGRFF